MSWTDWAQLAVQAYGAYSGSKAQSDAAKAAGNQAAAGSAESNALLREFYNRDEARNQPFYQGGVAGLNQYMAMLGLGGVQAAGGAGGFQNWVEEDANGVPIPNAQLYQSDPQYRAAWDAALQTHQGQWKGNGYWHGSDNEWIRSQIGQRYTPPAQPAAGQPAPGGQTPQQLQQAAYAQFRNQPGYQFGLQEGVRSIDASSAASGTRNSGKTLKALMQYGQNYADQQGYTPYMNRLASLAGIGQTTANQMGNAGQQYGGAMSGNIQNAANARAQSTYAQGQARSQMYNDFGQIAGQYGANKGWWG